MSAGNVNYELERSGVGLGLRSVKQRIKYSELTDSTTTGTITLNKAIPAYAMVIGTKITTHTAFTGGTNTTATITVGATAGEDDWTAGGSAGSVYTAGTLMTLSETVLEVQTSEADVIARVTVSADYTTISAGEMTIEVFYLSTVPELG